jgi:tRNA threonylcarbamoyl adenosine modification protein (Sua5/YciO/YrdC/YwlC family)
LIGADRGDVAVVMAFARATTATTASVSRRAACARGAKRGVGARRLDGSGDDAVRSAARSRRDGRAWSASRVVDARDDDAVGLAVRALAEGKVIAVPTDTIYGFAACARSAVGVEALYRIKSRNAAQPLAIAVGDVRDVGTYGEVEHLPRGLLEAILPGPVTVLTKRRAGARGASESLNPGVDLIGIRVPNSDFVRAVCRAHQGAIALTSANKSGETSTTAVDEFAPLWDGCERVFDGGRIEAQRLGSTIVDLSSHDGAYAIVREGERCASLMRVLEDVYNLRLKTTT